MKPISHLVEVAAWVSFRSLPPKEAMVAFVVTDMVVCMCIPLGFVDGVEMEIGRERKKGWMVYYINNDEGKYRMRGK